MWKKIGVAAVVALLAVVGGAVLVQSGAQKQHTWPEALREQLGAPEYESIDPSKPIDQQTAVFEMAGRTFEMPKVYIQGNLGGKRIIDGINLIYVMPDFTSRVDFVNRRQYDQAKAEGRHAHMLVQRENRKPSFDFMVESRRNAGLTKEEYAGVVDGLEYYKLYRGTPEEPIFYDEIYVERNSDGTIESFIECAPKERGAHIVSPGCSHMFRDKGLYYDIYYNKANYLSTWRDQRRKAVEFIDGFEKPEASK